MDKFPDYLIPTNLTKFDEYFVKQNTSYIRIVLVFRLYKLRKRM